MARVRFTADFDYRPTKVSTIAYKKGMVETVRRECADQAVAEGKAVELKPLRRDEVDKPSDEEVVSDGGRG